MLSVVTLKEPLVPAAVVLAPLGPVSVVVKVPVLLFTARFILAGTILLMVIVESWAVPVAASTYSELPLVSGKTIARRRRTRKKLARRPERVTRR